jgi:hypothetical protein
MATRRSAYATRAMAIDLLRRGDEALAVRDHPEDVPRKRTTWSRNSSWY